MDNGDGLLHLLNKGLTVLSRKLKMTTSQQYSTSLLSSVLHGSMLGSRNDTGTMSSLKTCPSGNDLKLNLACLLMVLGKVISPIIESLSKKYPHMTTFKVDIHQHQKSGDSNECKPMAKSWPESAGSEVSPLKLQQFTSFKMRKRLTKRLCGKALQYQELLISRISPKFKLLRGDRDEALTMDAGTGFSSQVYELSPHFLHKIRQPMKKVFRLEEEVRILTDVPGWKVGKSV
ncbi:hypothetical protein C5167_051142 [Papaver somniferum]|uniref:Uncharacterized protein n=1 Tax=Papaver somniferum TaxID=3469 RepID=A0A4Y7KU65_PAPSO|nr:hypothetical protein C5167_051142 [Papaver somniferum]